MQAYMETVAPGEEHKLLGGESEMGLDTRPASRILRTPAR